MSESVETVQDNDETKAHEDFLTVEHFAMLKENGPILPKDIGSTVAVLVTENDMFKIYHGRIYGSLYDPSGMYYSVVTRDGLKIENVYMTHTAVI